MHENELPHWVFELRGRVFTLETAMEFVMAQVDILIDTLTAISTDVDAGLQKVTELEDQLKTLQATTPPEVDLTAAINLASSIRQRLDGALTTATDATATQTGGDPTPQPQPETAA